jgi:hypothetical protein
VFTCLILGSSSPCQAIPVSQLDARALALAGTTPSGTGDARSLWWNAAALLSTDTTWSVSWGASRPFGLGQLRTLGVAAARTSPRMGFAAGAAAFGDDPYRETTFSAGGALRLSGYLCAGVALHLTDVSIRGFGRSGMIATSWGAMLRPSETVTASFVASSLFPQRWGELLLTARRVYSAAVEYAVSPRVRLLGSVANEAHYGWSHAVALAVRPHPRLSLYLGRSDQPTAFSGGCEISSRFVRITYGMRLHPELDPTHALTVTLVR